MSDFSEKCKEYVLKSNTNIYQLAKQTGLERTTLQRMVNGNRLPAIQIVRQFCSHLQVTPPEEEELLELYKIEKIGRDAYQTRREIRNLLTDVQKLGISRRKTAKFWSRSISSDLMTGAAEVHRFTLELDTSAAIQYVIEKEISQNETAFFDMDIIPQSEYVLQHLLQAEQQTEKKIVCRHYVSFFRRNSTELSRKENIQILRLVIPFAFSFRGSYQVNYSYRTCMGKESSFHLWPHFLITSGSLMLFSDTESGAVLIENKQIIDCYRDELREMAKQSKPLFDYYNVNMDAEEALCCYYENVKDETLEISFTDYPCVHQFFYPELVKTDQMQNACLQKFFMEREKSEIQYFGFSGLKNFIENGKLPGIYGKYTRIYRTDERYRMLEYYSGYWSMGSRKRFALKEGAFQSCKDIVIEIYDNGKVFFLSNSERDPFIVVGIHEWGIYDAFRDYFISLQEGDEVYAEEEVREVLQRQKNIFLLEHGRNELEAGFVARTG